MFTKQSWSHNRAARVDILAFIGIHLIIITAVIISVVPLRTHAASTLDVGSSWQYSFKVDGTLNETGSLGRSASPYFWLSSGAKLLLKDGVGMTVQGRLPSNDAWRLLYSKSNPLDTDNGYLPQNIFRLVTRSTWEDLSQKIRFKITSINETDSPNRGEWSGLLLMSHYKDQYNLYYAGIRMDGQAVIKKKYQGKYYTLAYEPVWTGSRYDRDDNPNLIPKQRWMGLKSTVEELSNGGLKIELWLDRNDNGTWEKVASTIDAPGGKDGNPILGKAHAGVRTDYMDVTFDDYTLSEL